MRSLFPFRRRSALISIAVASALSGCSKAPPESPGAGVAAALPKVRFKTDWYPQSEHGGFYQAAARGFYREAGIDLEIVPGGPGVPVEDVVLAGQVDLAMGRSDDLIVWASKGLPLVVVGVYMERDPQAILIHEDDPVRTFADLNGRTIMGVPGSNWIDYLKAHYHIEFNLIPSNFGIAQFMADDRFIQQCFVTNEPYYVQKNGGHPRTLLMSDSGFNPYRVIYSTRSFVRDHPDEVRAFIAASLRGWDDFMNGDPAPAKGLISKLNPNMTDEFMRYSIKAMKDQHIVFGKPELGERLGLMTRKRLQEQVVVLQELKMIPQLIPLEKFALFSALPADLQQAAQ